NQHRGIEIGEDVHLHVVEFVRPARGVADSDRVGDLRIVWHAWCRSGYHRNQHVIDQVSADAGQIDHGLDAERRQFGARPNAGAQQNSRRIDRAGRKRHPARANGLQHSAAFDFDPSRTPALDDYAMDAAEGPDSEVEPMAGRTEIADGRGDAYAVTAIARPRPDAG